MDTIFRYTYSPLKNKELLEIKNRYVNVIERLKWREEFKMKDQEFIVQKIRSQYTEKQHTELDELKALDARVKKPANLFGYIYGSLSAIIMGSGMSLVMTEIGSILGIENAMVPGILVGILGLVMALTTYPIYKRILDSRRKKYASQILELSDKITKG